MWSPGSSLTGRGSSGRAAGSSASGAAAGSIARALGKARASVVRPASRASRRAAAFSRPARSQAEEPLSRWSTGGSTSRMRAPPRIRAAPSQARTQTQRISGLTSQNPPGRTPPQGPFLSSFGQFIGQDMPVEESTHWPHIRQSKSRPLAARSTSATGRSIRS